MITTSKSDKTMNRNAVLSSTTWNFLMSPQKAWQARIHLDTLTLSNKSQLANYYNTIKFRREHFKYSLLFHTHCNTTKREGQGELNCRKIKDDLFSATWLVESSLAISSLVTRGILRGLDKRGLILKGRGYKWMGIILQVLVILRGASQNGKRCEQLSCNNMTSWETFKVTHSGNLL